MLGTVGPVRHRRCVTRAELQHFFARTRGGDTTWATFHDPDGPARAVHMDEGDGERYREPTRAGLYRCLLPECDAHLVVHAGAERLHHWQHPAGLNVEHRPETVWHLTAKAALAEWAAQQRPDADVVLDAQRTPGGSKPDVWVRWPGAQVAFEAQHSDLSGDTMQQRTARYVADGIVPVWLFSHLVAPVLAGDASGSSEQTVRLKQAHRVAADSGPLRWFNPELRQVATAYAQVTERPDEHRGEHWYGEKPDAITYVRYAIGEDRVARVRIDPLDDCILDETGLHTPTDRWIEAQAAEAETLTAAATEAHHAKLAQRLRKARREPIDTSPAVEEGRSSPERQHQREPYERGRPVEKDLLDRECYVCRADGRPGVPLGLAPIEEKPDWYLAPAAATHLVVCSGCGQIYSTR